LGSISQKKTRATQPEKKRKEQTTERMGVKFSFCLQELGRGPPVPGMKTRKGKYRFLKHPKGRARCLRKGGAEARLSCPKGGIKNHEGDQKRGHGKKS